MALPHFTEFCTKDCFAYSSGNLLTEQLHTIFFSSDTDIQPVKHILSKSQMCVCVCVGGGGVSVYGGENNEDCGCIIPLPPPPHPPSYVVCGFDAEWPRVFV